MTIEKVAIKINDVVCSMDKPKRHHTIIRKLKGHGLSFHDQGFIDDKGNYLTREQAKEHGLACGQITKTISHTCTSEDFW